LIAKIRRILISKAVEIQRTTTQNFTTKTQTEARNPPQQREGNSPHCENRYQDELRAEIKNYHTFFAVCEVAELLKRTVNQNNKQSTINLTGKYLELSITHRP
jgi:hypothetical protein